MPQEDYNIANDTGANVRTDLNNHMAAIVQHNSGATTPGTTFAHQLWADTSPSGYSIFKVRDAGDSAWATVFDDLGHIRCIAGTAALPSHSFGGDIDTGWYSDVSNELVGSVAGSEHFRLTATGLLLGSSLPAAPDGRLHVYSGNSGATANLTADEGVFENSTHGGISILTPNTGQGNIYFGSPSSNSRGRIIFDHLGPSFAWVISATTEMDLDATALTLASNNLILTAGDLTVTAGDTTLTAGDLQVTAGDSAFGRNVIAGVRMAIQEATTQTADMLRLIQGSTGDVAIGFALTAGEDYMMGIDNSDGDSFKIAKSVANLATNTRFRIDTTGAITIPNLAGSGSRTVVVDANGVLSAP